MTAEPTTTELCDKLIYNAAILKSMAIVFGMFDRGATESLSAISSQMVEAAKIIRNMEVKP